MPDKHDKEHVPKRSGYPEPRPIDPQGDPCEPRPETPHEPQNDPAHKPKPSSD